MFELSSLRGYDLMLLADVLSFRNLGAHAMHLCKCLLLLMAH